MLFLCKAWWSWVLWGMAVNGAIMHLSACCTASGEGKELGTRMGPASDLQKRWEDAVGFSRTCLHPSLWA